MRTVKQWVGETVGGLPRPFWYLWTNTLINRIGSFALILLALYLTQERGLTASFAGLVVGLWGAGGAIGTLIGGVLADRWGRKRTMLTALYAAAAMMIVLGMARGKLELALAVFVLGFVSESSRPASSAMMIDIVPEKDRLRAFSLWYWVVNLGFAFAAVTAGLVASLDFQLVFVIDAATTAIGATLIALKVREPARAAAPVQAAASSAPRAGLATVFRDRVFLGFVGLNVLTALVFMQHISMLPISMAEDGLSPQTYGLVIALNGVLIVIGQLFMPRLLKNLRRASAMALAALIMGIGFGLTAFAHVAWFYAVTVLIWTVGEMINAPSNSATNAELSPAHMRGRYQGVFSLSWSAASFIAPIAGGYVLEHAGSTTLWLGCLGLGIIVAVLNILAGPARERRAAILATAASGAMAMATATDAGAKVTAGSSEPSDADDERTAIVVSGIGAAEPALTPEAEPSRPQPASPSSTISSAGRTRSAEQEAVSAR